MLVCGVCERERMGECKMQMKEVDIIKFQRRGTYKGIDFHERKPKRRPNFKGIILMQNEEIRGRIGSTILRICHSLDRIAFSNR